MTQHQGLSVSVSNQVTGPDTYVGRCELPVALSCKLTGGTMVVQPSGIQLSLHWPSVVTCCCMQGLTHLSGRKLSITRRQACSLPGWLAAQAAAHNPAPLPAGSDQSVWALAVGDGRGQAHVSAQAVPQHHGAGEERAQQGPDSPADP